jgi:hypothetical protein
MALTNVKRFQKPKSINANETASDGKERERRTRRWNPCRPNRNHRQRKASTTRHRRWWPQMALWSRWNRCPARQKTIPPEHLSSIHRGECDSVGPCSSADTNTRSRPLHPGTGLRSDTWTTQINETGPHHPALEETHRRSNLNVMKLTRCPAGGIRCSAAGSVFHGNRARSNIWVGRPG